MPLTFTSGLRWEDFVRSLIAQSQNLPTLPADLSHGPILLIRTIRFKDWDAPAATRELVREIMTSGSLVDRSSSRGHIGGDEVGSMRQIHENDSMYLPRFTYNNNPNKKPPYLQGLSNRARLYEQYVREHKAHSNNRGGGSKTTGYVEYTAGENTMYNRGNRARIVFDYVNSKAYFAPLHYSSWTLPTNPLHPGTIVDNPGSGNHPNPWFWITDVTVT